MKTLLAYATASVLAASTLALTSTASAQSSAGSGLLAPSTRPGFATGALGFGIGDGGASFQLGFGAGTHFSGNSSGFAIAGELQLFIGGGFGMQPGVRGSYDIPIGNLPLYLSPSVRLGVPLFFGGGLNGGGVAAGFVAGPAFDVRFVLGDRAVLFARPVGLDFGYLSVPGAGGGFMFRYEFMLGGGITF